jgi:hypothetical protein
VVKRLVAVPSDTVSRWVEHCLSKGYTPYKTFAKQYEIRSKFQEQLELERQVLDVLWQVDSGLLEPKPYTKE